MKNDEKEVKAAVNSLLENNEELGKVIAEGVITGSQIFREGILGNAEDEACTAKGAIKDTLNTMGETAETLGEAVTGILLKGSKKIRNRLLNDETTEADK